MIVVAMEAMALGWGGIMMTLPHYIVKVFGLLIAVSALTNGYRRIKQIKNPNAAKNRARLEQLSKTTVGPFWMVAVPFLCVASYFYLQPKMDRLQEFYELILYLLFMIPIQLSLLSFQSKCMLAYLNQIS